MALRRAISRFAGGAGGALQPQISQTRSTGLLPLAAPGSCGAGGCLEVARRGAIAGFDVVGGAAGGRRLFSAAASAGGEGDDDVPFSPPEKGQTFVERRRVYKSEMHKMRKEWQAEVAAVEAVKAAELAAKKAAFEAEKTERRAAKEASKGQKTALVAEREKARVVEKEVSVRRASARRRQREYVLDLRRQAREESLLTDSRDWITPEDLDKRIEYALKNPSNLY